MHTKHAGAHVFSFDIQAPHQHPNCDDGLDQAGSRIDSPQGGMEDIMNTI